MRPISRLKLLVHAILWGNSHLLADSTFSSDTQGFEISYSGFEDISISRSSPSSQQLIQNPFVDRGMHPWRTTNFPDIGKWLYRKVHSLHHKSYNPTSFSGTNMHPVESTLYYSAAFIPCLWACHPTIALTALYDCAIGAWLGEGLSISAITP